MKSERYKKVFRELEKKVNDTYKGQKMNLNSYIRLGLLVKYAKSIKAIYKLDISGFFEDANIILRTVFETFITIVYCETNPEKLYKKFFDFNVFTRLSYSQGNDEISQIVNFVHKEDISIMKKKKEEFKKKYNQKNSNQWDDMSIKNLCEELDKYYNTSFYKSMYIIIYKNFSEYIHPNIVNIFENYISIENKKLKLNLKEIKDEEYLEIIENIESMNEKLLEIDFRENIDKHYHI